MNMESWYNNAWRIQQSVNKLRGQFKMEYLNTSHEIDSKIFNSLLELIFDYTFGHEDVKEEIEKTIDCVRTNAYHYIKEYCYFNFVFFNLKMKHDDRESLYFVLHFQKKDGSNLLLDMSARHYKSWMDFIENNKLPKCYMIYPKYFSYSLDNTFVELTCEESISCSLSQKLKSTFEEYFLHVSCIAAASCALLFNQKLLFTGLGAVAAIVYNYENRKPAKALKQDKQCVSMNDKTKTNVGEVFDNDDTAVNKGSAILVYFIEIYKETGTINPEYYKEFVKFTAFSYLAYASESTFQKMIEKLSNISIRCMNYLTCNPKRFGEMYRMPKIFTSSDSVSDLIQLLFPNIGVDYMLVFDITNSMINTSNEINETIKKVKNSGDDFELTQYLFQVLPNFAEEFDLISCEIRCTFRKLKLDNIEKDNNTVLQTLYYKNSMELMINTMNFEKNLLIIEPSINYLLEFFYKKKDSDNKEYAKNKLFNSIQCIIHSDILKERNIDYISEKVIRYFYHFSKLYLNYLEKYYLEYYIYTIEAKRKSQQIKSLNEFINKNDNEASKEIFTHTLKQISSELDEEIHEYDTEEKIATKNNIYKFNVSSRNLTEKNIYDIAKEKNPHLVDEITPSKTTCKLNENENGIIAVLYFTNRPITLIFYLPISKNSGILLNLIE